MVTADAPVVETTRAEVVDAHRLGLDPGPAQQRPQLPRLHEAHARRHHRAGARRRRAHDQRPEGHPQQRLGRRRRLQQPVLRRAARRPAAGLHLQPGRGQGGGGGGRRAPTPSSAAERRLRQRRDQVRHQRHPRHAARLLQGRLALARRPRTPTAARRTSSRSRSSSSASRSAARSKDKAFYFLALDYQNGDSTKQTDPSRIEQRVVDYFASLGSPDENGPIDRTNDARVFLGKVDWQLSPKHLATLRYNYTWSEQENGTFDVDSWGASANAVEKDFSNAVTGSLISNLSSNAAQRVPLPVGAGEPAAALRRARTSPARPGRCPTPPSTSAAPTASASRSSSRSTTTTSASSSTTTSRSSRAATRSSSASSSTACTPTRPSAASRTAATSSARPTAS